MSVLPEPVHDRPPTPCHHPTYGVRLSEDGIRDVISDALPGHTVEAVEQLPSGKSFNNRIYFVALSSKLGDGIPLNHGVVLKLPGWNFRVDKIENEVINLLLIERHCPQIPVPRVVAWSEGGDVIQRIRRVDDFPPSSEHKCGTRITSHATTKPGVESRRMWILMTRLPEQALLPNQIETRDESIMQQLAGYMAQWRNIPAPTSAIGNLRFVRENHTNSDSTTTLLFDREIAVDGLLIGSAPSKLHSSNEYYENKLRGELAILEDNEYYAANRALVPLIQELLRDILPKSALFRRHYYTVSTFTHYDLSPRNILVAPNTSGKLQISGIVDFEFAGFFPAEEEFTNTCITGEGDWPTRAWQSFVEHLEACNVEVPQGKSWDQACALVRIIENIAPWQLRDGGLKGAALEKALQHARLKVEENVQLLKQG